MRKETSKCAMKNATIRSHSANQKESKLYQNSSRWLWRFPPMQKRNFSKNAVNGGWKNLNPRKNGNKMGKVRDVLEKSPIFENIEPNIKRRRPNDQNAKTTRRVPKKHLVNRPWMVTYGWMFRIMMKFLFIISLNSRFPGIGPLGHASLWCTLFW